MLTCGSYNPNFIYRLLCLTSKHKKKKFIKFNVLSTTSFVIYLFFINHRLMKPLYNDSMSISKNTRDCNEWMMEGKKAPLCITLFQCMKIKIISLKKIK